MRAVYFRWCFVTLFAILFLGQISCTGQKKGPLQVSKENPRYFAKNSGGKIIYLTGSHTWENLVDIDPADPPEPFDFTSCLDWMQQHLQGSS